MGLEGGGSKRKRASAESTQAEDEGKSPRKELRTCMPQLEVGTARRENPLQEKSALGAVSHDETSLGSLHTAARGESKSSAMQTSRIIMQREMSHSTWIVFELLFNYYLDSFQALRCASAVEYTQFLKELAPQNEWIDAVAAGGSAALLSRLWYRLPCSGINLENALISACQAQQGEAIRWTLNGIEQTIGADTAAECAKGGEVALKELLEHQQLPSCFTSFHTKFVPVGSKIRNKQEALEKVVKACVEIEDTEAIRFLFYRGMLGSEGTIYVWTIAVQSNDMKNQQDESDFLRTLAKLCSSRLQHNEVNRIWTEAVKCSCTTPVKLLHTHCKHFDSGSVCAEASIDVQLADG